MDRATARASASSRAPVTVAVISVDAPSPSAACWRARSRATASIAPPSRAAASRSGFHDRRRSGARRQEEDRVVRARVAVDRQLVPGPRGRRAEQSPERVRRHGRIGQDDRQHRGHARVDHAHPLGDPADRDRHRPVRRTPGSSTVVVAILVTESVVRNAIAAASKRGIVAGQGRHDGGEPGGHPLERQAGADDAGREVERSGDCRHRSPPRAARPISSWSASPAAPVAALALPLVDTMASAQPKPPRASPEVAARCARDSRTGAAANAFGVKTAAAAAGPPVDTMTARSGRPEALIPAASPPARKPAGIAARRSTGGRSAEDAGTRDAAELVMEPGEAVRDRPSRAGRGPG